MNMYVGAIYLIVHFTAIYGRSTVKDDINLADLENTVDGLIKELSVDSDDYKTAYDAEKINNGVKRLKEIKRGLNNDNKDSSIKENGQKKEIEKYAHIVNFDEFKKRFLRSDEIQRIIFHGKRDVDDNDAEEKREEELLATIKKLVYKDDGDTDEEENAEQSDVMEARKNYILTRVQDIIDENKSLRSALSKKEIHQPDCYESFKNRFRDAIKARLVKKDPRGMKGTTILNDKKNQIEDEISSENPTEPKERKELRKLLVDLVRYKDSLSSKGSQPMTKRSSGDSLLKDLYSLDKTS